MKVKYSAVSYGAFDPRGIRQMRVQAPALGSLLAEINLAGQVCMMTKLHPAERRSIWQKQ